MADLTVKTRASLLAGYTSSYIFHNKKGDTMGKILGTKMMNEDGFRRAKEGALIDGRKDSIKVFLSLPMSGLDDDQIKARIATMESYILESKIFEGSDVEFVHNLDAGKVLEFVFWDEVDNIPKYKPLAYLGVAIFQMADCDAVAFGSGWQNARGCKVEYEVARQYSIPIFRAESVEQLKRLKRMRENFMKELEENPQ